jgi:hypothetical protein
MNLRGLPVARSRSYPRSLSAEQLPRLRSNLETASNMRTGRQLVTNEAARRALAEFVATGHRPMSVKWEQV